MYTSKYYIDRKYSTRHHCGSRQHTGVHRANDFNPFNLRTLP